MVKPPSDRPTWGNLSKHLKVSRQSVSEWRKLPGAPREADPEPWKSFVDENGLGVVGNRKSKRRESLLESAVEKKNRLLDIQIAREERKSVLRSDLSGAAARAIALTKRELYQALLTDLPIRLEGKDIAERRAMLRAAADKICDEMSAVADVPDDDDG